MNRSHLSLSAVYFLSGTSAIIYQVAWQRLLTTIYGVGPVSTALIVTIYMFGLGIGALVGGHIAERQQRKLVGTYLFVEIALGLFGLLSLPLLNFLGQSTAGADYFWSSVYVITFLSVPT
ncbi:MAG: hypothetical protein AAGA30_14925, partial [Planctomycetota bacterium]